MRKPRSHRKEQVFKESLRPVREEADPELHTDCPRAVLFEKGKAGKLLHINYGNT